MLTSFTGRYQAEEQPCSRDELRLKPRKLRNDFKFTRYDYDIKIHANYIPDVSDFTPSDPSTQRN